MIVKAFIKVPLVLLENIFFSIFPNSRSTIEKYIYNPYQFNDKHIEYSRKQFDEFVRKIGGIDKIKNKNILELGPGGSIGFGLLALQNGASEYFALENGQHAFIGKKQLEFYKQLLGNNDDFEKFFILKNKRYIYNSELIKFIEIDQESKYDLPPNCIDFIYSCAVLEHVHNLDLCFSEMARVLKNGGIMNHEVDFRDHIFSQKSIYFLKISDSFFNTLFRNTGEYVNRKRFSYYKKLIRESRMEIIEVKNKESKKRFTNKKLLTTYPIDDLSINSSNMILKKVDATR